MSVQYLLNSPLPIINQLLAFLGYSVLRNNLYLSGASRDSSSIRILVFIRFRCVC